MHRSFEQSCSILEASREASATREVRLRAIARRTVTTDPIVGLPGERKRRSEFGRFGLRHLPNSNRRSSGVASDLTNLAMAGRIQNFTPFVRLSLGVRNSCNDGCGKWCFGRTCLLQAHVSRNGRGDLAAEALFRIKRPMLRLAAIGINGRRWLSGYGDRFEGAFDRRVWRLRQAGQSRT